MEEGDNDNEVKLIQSRGEAPEHNVQMSSLVQAHTFTHMSLADTHFLFFTSIMVPTVKSATHFTNFFHKTKE